MGISRTISGSQTMSTIRNITLERVSISDLNGFRTKYAERRQPVIITDLFKGEPIEELGTLEATRRRLAQYPVKITCNYVQNSIQLMKRLLSGRTGGAPIRSRSATVGEYLDLVDNDPQTPWILTEFPAPPEVIAPVNLARLGITKIVSGHGNQFEPDYSAAHSLMFIANPGNASDLHTDWDGRDVILYQVFGKKRVTLFPPESAPRLLPITVFGTVKLNGMPPDAREDFVRYAKGWDDLLCPGEAVYMPAFYWHHFEYIETALSFNFRYGGLRNRDALFLLKHAHRDMYLQNILACSLDQEKAARAEPVLRHLRDVVERRYKSARQKYLEVTRHLRSGYEELCPDVPSRDSYTWIDCNMFLDGILCSSYISPSQELNGTRRWYWMQKEKLRFILRLCGYRLANWA